MGAAITGLERKKYGRLKVLSLVGRDSGALLWECKCRCGKTTRQRGSNLVSGAVVSCGCHKSESMRKRNKKGTAGRPRRLITIGGKTMLLARWAEKLGVHPSLILYRVATGRDPANVGRVSPTMVKLNGVKVTIAEASRSLGCHDYHLRRWRSEQVVTKTLQKIFLRRGKFNLEVAT